MGWFNNWRAYLSSILLFLSWPEVIFSIITSPRALGRLHWDTMFVAVHRPPLVPFPSGTQVSPRFLVAFGVSLNVLVVEAFNVLPNRREYCKVSTALPLLLSTIRLCIVLDPDSPFLPKEHLYV